MIIKSLSGRTIYQSSGRTLRAALEDGVAKGVDFSGADFRKATLRGASLDGIRAKGASFWAADLSGADIGLGDLREADLRCVTLKDTCLAETSLDSADLRGAYFSGTLLEGAVLDFVRVSCPSFWDVDLSAVRSMRGLVYTHKGEVDVPVSRDAIVMRYNGERIVLNAGYCLWRDVLCGGHGIALPFSYNATKPIPKSAKEEMKL